MSLVERYLNQMEWDEPLCNPEMHSAVQWGEIGKCFLRPNCIENQFSKTKTSNSISNMNDKSQVSSSLKNPLTKTQHTKDSIERNRGQTFCQ